MALSERKRKMKASTLFLFIAIALTGIAVGVPGAMELGNITFLQGAVYMALCVAGAGICGSIAVELDKRENR